MMKYVYFFEKNRAEGKAQMKEVLGSKGANLAEMCNLGIPVPPGFTISAEICRFFHLKKRYPEGLKEEVEKSVKKLENTTGKKFGDPSNPLLVSVRSGAAVSMPGMMDTVLNIGLNSAVVDSMSKVVNERFALDIYRRLIQMFGNVVKGIEHQKFDDIMQEKKDVRNLKSDVELTAQDLREIVKEFKALYKKEIGEEFPENPMEQLWAAIDAVFKSWDTPRAIKYREINNIPHDSMGTAVNVQAMVFGNLSDDSATGVAFTRNPATGEKEYYGEYLRNAQGEDVVAGIRTPKPIQKLAKELPEPYKELVEVFEKLEKHYKDVQDVEFTIQKNRLYMLQTRTGKRTAKAAVKIAVDMVREGLITEKEAVGRIEPKQIEQLLHPSFDPSAKRNVIARGLNASPGAAVGKVVFTADEAVARKENNEKVVLVRNETSPDDIHGMNAAEGFLTARGGMTSHAAIVARSMGKPCVAGCGSLVIDYAKKRFSIAGSDVVVKEGEYISVDGTTGEVMLGQLKCVKGATDNDFDRVMEWADSIRKLGVRANADTPKDAQTARRLGAEGIGLARTEHMFFGEDRLPLMQGMILSKSKEERVKYLEKLMGFQKSDFKELLRVMDKLPVIIRLLDPPLHEFLPGDEASIKKLSRLLNIEEREIKERAETLEEANPMLGHRGCRLGISMPEIYEMQSKAIIEASLELTKEGLNPKPRIMIPLVGHEREFEVLHEDILKVIKSIDTDSRLDYKIGTMIEIPRACVVADRIAEKAEFFSFGTNDLTQMTFGFSRDDAESFLKHYEEKVFKENPFKTIDREGVGVLMKMCVEKARSINKKLSIGICGEHGGEPKSIEFCHSIGLDYVSASPFRVPIARLAAAQAAIRDS